MQVFYKSLLTSPCRELNILARVMASDIRTTTGKNIRLLEEETGGLTWSAPGGRIRKH